MLINYLQTLGYSKKDAEKIINNPSLKYFSEENLCKNIKEIYEFYIEVGFIKQDIIYMTKKFPHMYGLNLNNIKRKFDNLINNGYSQKEVIYMIKNMPNLISLDIENINTKQAWLRELGYKDPIIHKMTKKFPKIYSYSIQNMIQKFNGLVGIGYSQINIIHMTSIYPMIYGLNIKTIKQKIEDLINLGYSKEQILKMTIRFPQLFGLTLENIKSKINYFRSIELGDLILKDANVLVQSVSLTYARYEFFKENHIKIDSTNANLLFLGAKVFEERFFITKQDLINKYNYQDYLERDKTI